VLDERVGDGVPVARVVAAAVDEQARRLALVSPDGVVEPQPLRLVVARFRFDDASSPGPD
jgi:hypothetical protein